MYVSCHNYLKFVHTETIYIYIYIYFLIRIDLTGNVHHQLVFVYSAFAVYILYTNHLYEC